MRFVVWLLALVGLAWLCARLWPAVRTEPATWLGEDWREQIKRRLGA